MVRMSEETHQILKIKAAEKGKSIKEVLESIVKAAVKN